MADVVPSLHAADMVGSQFFPLYLYDGSSDADESEDSPQGEVFSRALEGDGSSARREGITDEGLAHFRTAYPGETICKEDLFYYVYGILHSPDYRDRYVDNLGKELPRIPRVKSAADFWAFSRAGRELGDLHVGYEQVPEYPARIEVFVDRPASARFRVERKKARGTGGGAAVAVAELARAKDAEVRYGKTSPSLEATLGPAQYRVKKMTFGKAKRGDGKLEKDRSVVRYNEFITVCDIPLEAYDYVVNGKPAIEWVMERQGVTTDKASGIVKDANDWAVETMHDPRYPLSLLLRVITVSLETVKIVRALPPLDILADG